MKHRDLRRAKMALRTQEDLSIERSEIGLLLTAALCFTPACRVSLAELVAREDIEQVEVLAGESGIPLTDTATRQHDDALWVDPKDILEPSEKRNPVQDFVAHFAKPRTRHDR